MFFNELFAQNIADKINIEVGYEKVSIYKYKSYNNYHLTSHKKI
jgi:hypothetical protein